MNKFGQRLLIWGVLLCFAVFFGVDMASKGISDTGGPGGRAAPSAQHGSVVTAEDLIKEKPEPEVKTAAVVQTKQIELGDSEGQLADSTPRSKPADPSNTAMEGLAVSAGQALRSTAQSGVELVVSLIDGILN